MTPLFTNVENLLVSGERKRDSDGPLERFVRKVREWETTEERIYVAIDPSLHCGCAGWEQGR